MLGEPAGSLEESLIYEYRRPDLNRFEELRSRRSPVSAISTETGGEMRASARFREMIEPTGSADELRAAFVDPFGLWAALVIFTDRRMNAADLDFVSHLLPGATAALRRKAATRALDDRRPAADGEGELGPSVLILDRDDRILAADAVARRRLATVPDPRPRRITSSRSTTRWASRAAPSWSRSSQPPDGSRASRRPRSAAG